MMGIILFQHSMGDKEINVVLFWCAYLSVLTIDRAYLWNHIKKTNHNLAQSESEEL